VTSDGSNESRDGVSDRAFREGAVDLLAMVLDQLPVVLFATDDQGVITIARGKGAVRLGPGAVGKNAFELFAGAPRVVANLRRALGGEALTTEGENDGVWWETRYMPLRGPGGEVKGVVGVTMDATARKRAEEDLKKANARLTELDALKARFVANVSHELRTPLALVLGVTERMRKRDGEAGVHARDLASVEHNARLLLEHVNDLLDVAKLDAGKARPDYAEVDLARLVALVAAQFESVAAERGLDLLVEVPESLPAAVDPDQVQRVILNLLSNAFKLTPRGGTVRCALERASERAAITVADSGPGVPPSRREVIFERFVQIDRGDEQRFGGTGLGLSIVRDYVEMHGGGVAVDDAPEGGARFVVTLPLAPAEGTTVRAAAELHTPVLAASDALVPPRDGPESGVTPVEPSPVVLVVEDNPEMRRFMVETLGGDFVVTTAEDGEHGLAAARARRPAAIVTDLMMPRMSGEQLLRAVRADHTLADTPVLVLTARADDDVRLRLLREGAHDYVLKPFAADELRARVVNAVALKNARDVLARELQSSSRDLGVLAVELVDQQRNVRYALESTRAAREEAERAAGVKSAFLGAFSQRVGGPLATLRHHAELLVARRDLTADASASADAIAAASSHLVEVLDTLLEHANVQSGKLSVRPEVVDLARLVRGVVAEFAPRAEGNALTLGVTADEELAPARTDPRLVRVLLANLVGDAVDGCRNGTVGVAVSQEPRGHVVRVRSASRDSHGVAGDPVEIHGRRARGSGGPDRWLGLGLGLAIVRHVADTLGAIVEVTPDEPARGHTLVTVVLPRAVDERVPAKLTG